MCSACPVEMGTLSGEHATAASEQQDDTGPRDNNGDA